jgi:predicted outer membrane repeat protein
MGVRANLKAWRAMLLFLVGIWCASFAVASAYEVYWIHGEDPPSTWNISPDNPVNTDIIHFSGPIKNREIYDNSCLAEQAMGGTATLTINAVSKNIELRFEPPAPESCPPEYDPVCGLEGSFGPLEEGEWTFWAYFPGWISSFSFQVGSIHHVDANATGTNDGTSWNNAYNYLQDALADAAGYDQIWVGKGVYNPDCNSNNPSGTNDRTATFQLINDVAIKGGYAGFGAPDPNAWDIETYKTILSGDLDGNDVGDFNDPSKDENSYHVVTGSGTDNKAVLDGFTITAGNANGSGPSNNGGGMYNNSGNPTISNCTLSMNFAEQNGGGIYCDDYSVPTLTNCIVNDNRAGNDGGGVYNYDHSDVTLTNCTVSGNTADNDGGGVCNKLWSDMILNNCLIHNNTAGNDGGGVGNTGDLMITNSMISGNSAIEYAGAVYNWECTSTLTNCTFADNSASIGNALAYDSVFGNHQVTNCILWDGGSEIWHNASLTISVTYSDVQGGWTGVGNIDADPCFADMPEGDYHLRTKAGRWDLNQNQWVVDVNTSACIDAGDPNSDWTAELWPHGKRMNMGAYGGTPQASMSLSSAGNIADLTNNGVLDWKDLKLLGDKWVWQEVLLAEDLNRDGIVNFIDFAVFAGELADTSAAEPNITYQIDDCNQEAFELFALVSSGETRFTVTVEGPYIHFEDMMVANCCPDELALEMTVEDDLITIYETEYSLAPCWCICDYPVTATLGPFQPGTYTLEVYQDYGGFIGSTIVSIGSTK